jgi:5-methylcytosine-specific restriction endonuclease McrA
MIRPCHVMTCPEPAVYRGYCERHRKDRDRQARSRRRKLYDAKARWRPTREKVLSRDPICQICGEELATEVHHTDPERLWELDTLQALCKRCHAIESRREQLGKA